MKEISMREGANHKRKVCPLGLLKANSRLDPFVLEEDVRSGLVDKKMTLDRVLNDRILKRAQGELRAEGRLK